jgi:hypothetical protein
MKFTSGGPNSCPTEYTLQVTLLCTQCFGADFSRDMKKKRNCASMKDCEAMSEEKERERERLKCLLYT